jgi:NADPH:quinone reductase-like Zn-dependent oxidoreductase
MRAFAINAYNAPLHAVDVPEPGLGERDVLVRVDAASINQIDVKLARGEFKQVLPYEMPLVLGHDLAGTVLEVGSKVRRFKPGDEVYARPRDGRIGAFAERIAIAEEDVASKPRTLTMAEAASLPLVALTAWQVLVERGNLKAGQKVLIHAGAGGVGSITIQLAKHLGAHIATTAAAERADFVRGLGADEVIDYRTQDFAAELNGYDLVVDSLGADNVARSLEVLKPGGKVIGISSPPTPEFARAAGMNAVARAVVRGISRKVRSKAKKLRVSYEFLLMRPSGEQLRALADLVDAGALKPVVGKTFPFDQTPQAFDALAAGIGGGKAVITRA